MKGGRKNLKRAVTDDDKLILQQGQTIMQVVSLRGSNHIEVMDAKGQKSLALFPSKFQKSIWIKRGGFVVVDESGREKALESGSKVACTVSQVLFHEQVRELQKSQEWSEIIKSTSIDQSNENLQRPTYPQGEEINSSDDEGLPPLEANLNRIKPLELLPDTDSESETDE